MNKNLHVYETEDDILLVDVGVAFPDAEEPGVDVIIPDVGYLRDKVSKIRGIVITHGNYDHFAALPYVLPEIGRPPIYTAKMTLGFIRQILEEHQMFEGQTFHLIEPEVDSFDIGTFHITPFRVNHAVPDTFGLFIKTPEGNFVHTPDYKFDWTPSDGKKFEVQKLAQLSQEGVVCLMSDSLGATKSGYAVSERLIKPTLEKFISSAPQQVFVTTISSNINRIQQIVELAVKLHRKVGLLGRSISQNVEMARQLGYITAPRGTFVSPQKAEKLPPEKRLYLSAGSFGQIGSALQRLSVGENVDAEIKKDDTVIFSSHPIPGTYDQIDKVIDNLTERGAHVIYSEIQDYLHTSGHGGQGDITLLVNLVNPQYLVPTGGTFKHMRAFSLLMDEIGYNSGRVFEVPEGQVLEFRDGKPRFAEKIETEKIFVDGSQVGDVGRIVLQDRRRLAEEGIVVVIVKKNQKGKLRDGVSVVSRGFVYVAESERLMDDAVKVVEREIRGGHVREWNKIRRQIERQLGDLFYKNTKRSPMVLPVLVGI